MKLKTRLFFITMSLCSTLSYAQWEFTLAAGVNYEQLPLSPPAGASLGTYEESDGTLGYLFSGQVGYRLNDHWALRSRLAFVERSQQKGSLFIPFPNSEVTASYLDLTAEAAYYFNPYFSIAVGAGPAINTSHTLYGAEAAEHFDDLILTTGTFARGGIALEGHLRNLDARLEHTFGLSNARNDGLQFTNNNGAPLGSATGTWGGVMLTVGYQFMLGKDRYCPDGSIDSFFRKYEKRFQEKHPRLAMDVGFAIGASYLSPNVLFKDGTQEVYNRSNVNLRFDYLLNPKWSAISAIEFGSFVSDLQVDSIPNTLIPIENANTLGLRAGLRYQPFRMWGASMEIASSRLFNRQIVDNASYYEIETFAPLKTTQVLGSLTGYITIDRWEAFGRISYTLTQPYTQALDTRYGSPTIRQNRITDVQAGIHYRIFRRAS